MRECVLRFLPRADAAGVDLGARGIDDAGRGCAADPTLLEGILNNLIDNALRYGAAETAPASTVTVAVEQRRERGRALGAGQRPRRARATQQVALAQRGAQGEAGQLLGQGAGLGLALVAQYARLMDGAHGLAQRRRGRGWVCEIAFSGARPAAS